MKKLFEKLYSAETEKELLEIVNSDFLMRDSKNWKPYGGNKGNFGTFESQQNHPVPALIEKITNSIDATLIKDCLLNGIDPKSSEAPRSMSTAVEKFYEVKGGEIGELLPTKRRALAENIQVIATGEKKTPSITIYDFGEGQSPEKFEDTFLSLHRSNKTNIHFVQGKYNMGSTGAVVFCGEHKFQLIGSKRDESLTEIGRKDFGFTLVRRHQLTEVEEMEFGKATWYEYFCPEGAIPSFEIDEMDLGLYNRKFTTGSLVKLYSYQMPRGSRSDVTLDLWRDLNQYMYHLPLPVSVYEKRDYSGKSSSKPVLGNRTRITIDSREKVSEILPYNIPKEAGLGEIPIEVIIFESDVDHNEFIKNKSIIFTQNGQVHGFEGQSFVSQELGFSLLKKHTLIHVDCTNIPTSIRQDLFMSNRTHLKQGPKTETLRDAVKNLLKKSSELRKINNDRKNSLLQNSKDDTDLVETFLSKLPVDKDVIQLLKRDGALNFLEKQGKRLNPKQLRPEQEKKLNRFPSIFKLNLKENGNGKPYKTIPLNQTGKVEIETDIENDYLFRPTEKGQFKIEVLQKRPKTDKPVEPNPNPFPNDVTDIISVNREGPINGSIKLIIEPNEKAKVGDEVSINATLTAPGQEFQCAFDVKVDEKISKPKKKEPKPTETFPNLPTPRKAFEKPLNDSDLSWSNSDLYWNGEDIVKVVTDSTENSELFVDGIIVNMDSFALLRFLSKNKISSEKEIKFQKDKYFLSIYLHSLFIFSILEKMRKNDDQLKPIEVDEFVSKMIKPYANFLMYENYHITKFAFDD